ncbi:DUF3796 domain-containing protein [Amphibacillus sp. Q70]|uniref:DUF3796 domain-containing protein n=1 Tax=Amphibacillus sp. Q70 TaxID=3453416 RepID=UPI003F82AAA1
MKNKYGLIGFVSLLGFWGLYSGEDILLSFFAFIVFFQYFWIIPDELFIETLRKCAARAFFTNITITIVATFLLSFFEISSNPLAAGTSLGFSIAIAVFALSIFILEWKQLRGAHDD